MALNWNAYLADDALDASTDQWPDVPTPQTARPPTTATSTANGQSTVRFTPESDSASSYDAQSTTDAYFTEPFYQTGDYFLSDLEVLQPFGASNSTSESSPEPLSAIDLLDETLFSQVQNPTVAPQPSIPPQRASIATAQTQRSRAYSDVRNDPMLTKASFVEDLTFPNGPSGAATTTKSTFDRENTSLSVSKEPESTTKRSKQAKADALSACWTSPLCPNHTDDGPPPDPTTCGGACAPFLFAPIEEEDPATIVDQSILAREIGITEDTLELDTDSIIELPRHRKRSESNSGAKPSGRVFPKNPNTSTKMAGSVKEESVSNHDEESASPDAPEDQVEGRTIAKPRRRLPHNQVERKYRESLNSQLESLRRVVPSLQPHSEQQAQNGIDIEDLPTPSKPSKAVILASATAYIKQIEKEKKQIADENQMLRTRIKALQALVKCEDCSLMQYVMNMKIQGTS